jgi:hypothetical protein
LSTGSGVGTTETAVGTAAAGVGTSEALPAAPDVEVEGAADVGDTEGDVDGGSLADCDGEGDGEEVWDTVGDAGDAGVSEDVGLAEADGAAVVGVAPGSGGSGLGAADALGTTADPQTRTIMIAMDRSQFLRAARDVPLT